MPVILDAHNDVEAGQLATAAWREGALDVLDALSRTGFESPTLAVAAQNLIRELRNLLEGRSVVVRLEIDTEGAAGDRTAGDATRLLLRQVVRVVGEMDAERQEAAIARLAEIILPDPLADARGPLAVDNLALRDRFVAETGPLTSGDVADQAGYSGPNPYATAARWKKSGQIFSVHHRGTEYFPTFQFRDGHPHPAVRKVLVALPGRLSPWQRAFWFVTANGWLGNRPPAEVLDEVDAVVGAAGREAAEVMG